MRHGAWIAAVALAAAACGHSGGGHGTAARWRSVVPVTGDVAALIAVDRHTVYAYGLTMGHDADAAASSQEVQGTLIWDGKKLIIASGDLRARMLAAYGARLGWKVVDGRLQRWDGATWQTVTTVTPPIPDVALDGPVVSGAGADDAWVAGRPETRTGAADPSAPAYLAHWDGHRLTPVPAPGPPPDGLLTVSPTEAWAVGCDGTGRHGLVAGWDGTAWRAEPVPAGTGCLYGVAAIGGTVYAYGAGLLRHTGQGWQRVPGQPATPKQGVAALAGDGSGGLWAASGDHYLHLRGGHWTSYRIPRERRVPPGLVPLYGVALAAIPGTGAVWAVARTSGEEEGVPDGAALQRYGSS